MVYKIVAEDDRKYVDEFREAPITAHRSPGLQRILNIMRLYRGGDQYILIARREFHDYVIGRMPPLREDPILVEDAMMFKTREAAEWELFRRRWRQHTGETIDQHDEDEAI
jgi:branched-chain amino acid transport system permease protein